jgi:hypothetical protein
MSQQASDLPRFLRVIGRYKALVGLVGVLGLLGGALFAALNPPASSSSSSTALVMIAAPSCPQGAICGGPMFSTTYIGSTLAGMLPGNVQIKIVNGNVLSVTVSGGKVAQVIQNEIADIPSLSYMGEQPTVKMINAPTTVSAPVSPKRLFDDALLGAVLGLLVGVVAALAAGQTIIDPVALPRRRAGLGTQSRGAGQPVRPEQSGWGQTGFSLQQLAADYTNRSDDFDRSERFSPFPGEGMDPRVS